MSNDTGSKPKFGKIKVTDSYFNGEHRLREYEMTESFRPTDFYNAHARVFERMNELMRSGKARKRITVTFDLDDRTQGRSVKHVHIDHIESDNPIA